MDADKKRKAADVFASALELPTEVRTPYVERACGDDTELRAEVETLLNAHQDAARVVATAPHILSQALASDVLGSVIAHYKVTRRLGAGGMCT